MLNRSKHIVTDRKEIYIVLLLVFIILGINIATRIYMDSKTTWYIFFKNVEFVFLLGIPMFLAGNLLARDVHEYIKEKWLIKTHILREGEKIKWIITYGLWGGGGKKIRLDVITDQRILRYKKYFGITEEINFTGAKSFNYNISFMVMTMRFDTKEGIKIFEIVMTKSLQKEASFVLAQIMQEKGIPKNANL